MTGRGVYSLATGWVGLDLAAVQDEWFWKQVYSRVGG